MRKPSVKTKCVANAYAAPTERIVEYSANGIGGLISFTIQEDGTLFVHLYRHDPRVEVTVSEAIGIPVLWFPSRL